MDCVITHLYNKCRDGSISNFINMPKFIKSQRKSQDLVTFGSRCHVLNSVSYYTFSPLKQELCFLRSVSLGISMISSVSLYVNLCLFNDYINVDASSI